MRSYWFYLLFLAIAWGLSFAPLLSDAEMVPLRIVGTALFFALFFLAPLFRKARTLSALNLIGAAILAIGVFWPESESAMNPYPLLVFTMLAGKAVYRLSAKAAAGVGGLLMIGAAAPPLMGYPGFSPVFILLYSALLTSAFVYFKKSLVQEEELQTRNEALLSEYRKMKRRLLTDERAARQEERTQIARDIHDSVGHKLTALLMQLEVSRMQAEGAAAEQLEELKSLAKESLEETRSAVKTLRHDEEGGVTAIIALIRKLEAESFLRVQFSVKHGAISARLGNEQMVVVYRAVQEALTNIMRHSTAREADIVFEAPGGSIFRFTVSNRVSEKMAFQEGFGLSSMRERVEQTGGQLKAGPENGKFIVVGSLPLTEKVRDLM